MGGWTSFIFTEVERERSSMDTGFLETLSSILVARGLNGKLRTWQKLTPLPIVCSVLCFLRCFNFNVKLPNHHDSQDPPPRNKSLASRVCIINLNFLQHMQAIQYLILFCGIEDAFGCSVFNQRHKAAAMVARTTVQATK